MNAQEPDLFSGIDTRDQSYMATVSEGTEAGQINLLRSIYKQYGSLADREVFNISKTFGAMGTISARRNKLIELGEVVKDLGNTVTYEINGKKRTATKWRLIQ